MATGSRFLLAATIVASLASVAGRLDLKCEKCELEVRLIDGWQFVDLAPHPSPINPRATTGHLSAHSPTRRPPIHPQPRR